MYLSGYYNIKLYQHQSLIIFDEVQLCPKARAAIKYLVADGRYNYMETDSLISAAIYDTAAVIYDKYI
ncbi:AAA family ATPase [Cloacibacillus porcorum]|uniref:AAA family ATPase n=1 Tax=Cloacibacillus porcorum TaxID=1197717 RepID=UPI0009FC5CAA